MAKRKEMSTQLRFSVFELDRLVSTILANLSNTRFITNINALFNIFDESSYINDEEKATRVYLIKIMTDTVIKNNIQVAQTLLNTIDFNGKYANHAIEVLNNNFNVTVTEKESQVLDKKISQLLKFATIEQRSDKLITTINNIKSENYEDLESEIVVVEDEISAIQKNLKDYRETIDEGNNRASLDSLEFLSRLDRVIEKEKSPTSTVRTGIKLFNEILQGGFKAGRVYCCMAPMKNWKSGFLLSCAIWAKKFNDLKPKDPSKKPVALYITLENSVDETIVRMLSYCEGNNFNVAKTDKLSAAKIMEAHGLFNPNDSSALDIEILYKPNKSITVADIGIIMDDYEKEGKEVVFLCVDYLKRIRPSIITKDLRIDLGGIADDLHVLAIERDIPIVTAMQLNRSAISELDNADTFEKKMQAFGRIGASNVGESIDIPQNVDLTFTMVRTVDTKINELSGDVESIDKYLHFRIVAARYNTGDIDSFIHRFKDGNDMRLDEDADAAISRSIINKTSLIKDRVAASDIKTRGARHVG